MATLQNVVFITTFAGLALSLAIILLIVSQLGNDAKSIAFVGVASAVAGITLMSCLLQFGFQSHSTSLNPQTLLEVLCIPLSALPLLLFIFTVEYLSTWTRPLRIIGSLYVFQFFACVIVLLSHGWLYDVHFKPDGAIVYSINTAIPSLLVNAWLTAHTWYGFYLFARYVRRQRTQIDRSFVFGIVLIYAGILVNSILVISQYSVGTDLLVCGVVVLTKPVLKQRLFDPLSQLNQRLAHRAEQFALITRVGHQAHSVLNLDTLLPAIAREIQQAFGYTSVQVVVYKSADQCVAFGMSDADKHSFNQVDAGAQAVLDNQICLPSLDIPLNIGPSNTDSPLTGKLRVQTWQFNRFTAEEQEVLHILAQQIGLAIHNAQLFESAQRANAAKTNFISYVSHELRTNVGDVINISTGMLDEPGEYSGQTLPPAFQSDMRLLVETGNHLKQLLNNVIDWGQIESGHMQVNLSSIDPLPILQTTVQTAARVAKAGVQVCLEVPPTLPLIRADEVRLKQILRNLINNADKFTTSGNITIGAQPEGDFVRFFIADTGRGMSEAEQAHLFQPYAQGSVQIQAEFGGSGLGLNISEQLVRLHGGHIRVESTRGRGTTFHFTIPTAAADEKPSDAQQSSRASH